MFIVEYMLARLQERSTYVGMGSLLALVGVHLSDVQSKDLVEVLMAVAAFINVMLPDANPESHAD